MYKYIKLNKFWLNKAIITAVIVILTFNVSVPQTAAAWSFEDIAELINKPKVNRNLFMIAGGDSLMAISDSLPPKMMKVVITAYSSTPDQTDDTPFITASNTHVRDGVVAANFLAFGTKVKIPSLFGDKVFTVEDRMAKKHDGKIDIWFSEKHLAKRFGIQEADVVILD